MIPGYKDVMSWYSSVQQQLYNTAQWSFLTQTVLKSMRSCSRTNAQKCKHWSMLGPADGQHDQWKLGSCFYTSMLILGGWCQIFPTYWLLMNVLYSINIKGMMQQLRWVPLILLHTWNSKKKEKKGTLVCIQVNKNRGIILANFLAFIFWVK